MSTRSRWTVALATGMAWGLTSAALAAAAVDAAPINTPAAGATPAAAIDFSALLDPDTAFSQDPQRAGFSFVAIDETPESGPPGRLAASAWAMSRPAELADSPMAPLPPAVVAGPIGIAFASFIAWRAKRRGGRI